LKRYSGNRDPRFVTIHRGGDLDLATHRLLVAWAADCAEHVLPLFTEVHPSDARPSHAIAIAREWASGNATVAQAREAAFEAHAAARESLNSAATEVARAAGHAVATAHMADHELGAAAYAIWAMMKSVGNVDTIQVADSECRWQRAKLSDAIRELVLSDQQNRNPKFKNVFSASPPSFYQATSD
jgi:hypothetical protein